MKTLLVPVILAAIVIALLTTNEAVISKTGCDRSYPTVCIPVPPPELDCRDIAHRNFKVLAPDSHNFDRDRDGIGCEKR